MAGLWPIRPGVRADPGEMYSYFAYGLGIRCDVPLPDLMESDAPPDVVMRFGRAEPLQPVSPNVKFCLQFRGDRAFLRYRGLGSCEIIRGREIVGESEEEMPPGVVPLLAQGPGLSLLLHQRGYLTLHASCVKAGNSAVAFMGNAEAGKSTIAAALYANGHSVVADDVTVVCNAGPQPMAFPGYPGIHLLPDCSDHFAGQLGKPARIDADDRKSKFVVKRGFSQVPVPLKRIYLLEDGPDTNIFSISGHRAVYELVKHSYWIRLTHDFRPASYFLQCASLCARIPVMRLTRPRRASALAEVAQLIEEELLDTEDRL